MIKKIAILGSTGSIGKNLINILKKDKKNFKIVLLTADKNYNELIKQAKIFNVKNLILTNKNSFLKFRKKNFAKKVNIYNDFNSIKKIFKKKIDYTMSSISGVEGLSPTLKIIKHTKVIAIANKETIICAWNLIKRTKDLGYEIKISAKALNFLCDKGFDKKYGARPLKRSIQKYVEDLLAEEIIKTKLNKGDSINIDWDGKSDSLKINNKK